MNNSHSVDADRPGELFTALCREGCSVREFHSRSGEPESRHGIPSWRPVIGFLQFHRILSGQRAARRVSVAIGEAIAGHEALHSKSDLRFSGSPVLRFSGSPVLRFSGPGMKFPDGASAPHWAVSNPPGQSGWPPRVSHRPAARSPEVPPCIDHRPPKAASTSALAPRPPHHWHCPW
jgi:hypothetical protein